MPEREDKLKVGLVGTGEIARFYAQSIKNHVHAVDLFAVSSQTPERTAAFAESFNIPHAHSPHTDIFQSDLDALLIASASATHAPLIEEAARHQIDTFCDKPLGVSLKEIEAALDVVNRYPIQLATGFNRRFDPAFQKVHQQVQDGTIGTPEAILIISRDPKIPSPQEFATPHRLLVGTTIHDLDMARFLMQDEIVSVTTQGSWLKAMPPKTEQLDVTTVSLKFRNGGIGTIINSYRSNEGYDQRLELHGSHGCGRVENVSDTMQDVPHEAPFFVKRYATSYVEELKAFFYSLRKNQWHPNLATGADGKIASCLSEAAIKSWQNQAAVDL
ncbi:MAG: Gfo/Idh/MocA family oxidoreductase [Verrucomicrobiota bacterium]